MARAMIQFDLERWADGQIHLIRWDTLQGKDIHYILKEDGTVERLTYRISADEDDGDEIFTPVDLVQELRRIANNWRDKGEYP